MKATEQYFPVVQLIIQYKVLLTFEILTIENVEPRNGVHLSNESRCAARFSILNK